MRVYLLNSKGQRHEKVCLPLTEQDVNNLQSMGVKQLCGSLGLYQGRLQQELDKGEDSERSQRIVEAIQETIECIEYVEAKLIASTKLQEFSLKYAASSIAVTYMNRGIESRLALTDEWSLVLTRRERTKAKANLSDYIFSWALVKISDVNVATVSDNIDEFEL